MSNDHRFAPGSTTAILAIALVLTGAGLASIAAPSMASEDDPSLCDRPLDVMFVIDTSNSMRNELDDGSTRMEVARQGSVDLASQLAPKDTSGVVDFSKGVVFDKGLDANHAPVTDPTSTAGELDALEIVPPNGQTWTDKGIERAQQELDENGRAGVPNVMVLLTDGRPYPTYREPWTVQAADAAKAAGTELFVIGVGDDGKENLMKTLASDPDDTHYYHAETSDEVLAAFDGIRENLYAGQVQGESYAVRASAQAANANVDVNKVNRQLLQPGEEGTIETVTVTTSNPPLEIVADVAHGATDGKTDRTSGFAHAVTTIHRLRVTDTGTSTTLVSADLLRSESYSYATTQYASSWDGRTALAELWVANYGTFVSVPPNTVQIPLAGYGTLTLNEQVRTQGDAMSSLRVNAIHLELDAGTSPDTTTDVVIGSAFSGAYCGVRAPPMDDDGDDPIDVDPPDDVDCPRVDEVERYTHCSFAIDPSQPDPAGDTLPRNGTEEAG